MAAESNELEICLSSEILQIKQDKSIASVKMKCSNELFKEQEDIKKANDNYGA